LELGEFSHVEKKVWGGGTNTVIRNWTRKDAGCKTMGKGGEELFELKAASGVKARGDTSKARIKGGRSRWMVVGELGDRLKHTKSLWLSSKRKRGGDP